MGKDSDSKEKERREKVTGEGRGERGLERESHLPCSGVMCPS